jgi:glutamate N-acetyltransferase/amino-acid N-acetyltransferase
MRFADMGMVERGVGRGLEAEQKIAQVFKHKEFTVTVHLGQGHAHAHMWTTDLSYDYVRINASYRS